MPDVRKDEGDRLMTNVRPIRKDNDGRVASVRASINARAAHLNICDDIRRKWLGKAMAQLQAGATAGWAISEALRGMTSEHIAAGQPATNPPGGGRNGETNGDLA